MEMWKSLLLETMAGIFCFQISDVNPSSFCFFAFPHPFPLSREGWGGALFFHFRPVSASRRRKRSPGRGMRKLSRNTLIYNTLQKAVFYITKDGLLAYDLWPFIR